MKYIIVSGGVISGVGKGITASSIGALFQAQNQIVTCIKIDGYLNIDAGTLSPLEHGELFVLADGGETDLDLGNYEHFLDLSLTKDHNITTGKIFDKVLKAERNHEYLGKTVQMIPHVTDAIVNHIETTSLIPVDKENKIPTVCIIELGGTVGDLETLVFLEALRHLKQKVGPNNFASIHVSFVPIVSEPKTKPTQQSVRELSRLFVEPDLLICRSSQVLDQETISKIGISCMLPNHAIITVLDVDNIYQVPLILEKQNVYSQLASSLKIETQIESQNLLKWHKLLETFPTCTTIAIIGKYSKLKDSYVSIIRSLKHAAFHCNTQLEIKWTNDVNDLKDVNGILVPGGFGSRGIQEKLDAIKYARENNICFLGICLGMQLAVMEYCKNVLKWENCEDEEFCENNEEKSQEKKDFLITKMSQMRLGHHEIKIEPNTLASKIYKCNTTMERHRHRFQVNPKYMENLQFITSAKSQVMEIMELPNHKFYLATQFHPEFQSRPFEPCPIFKGFVQASLQK